ncbi:50S ribosomal protein L4 [Patescibacteria group bacterium]|nr:MAG: 50S ribosomal protein L4 [Patescibacteria group bacterium]
MSVATYTKAGAKATTPAKLDKSVFGVDVANHELVKDAYVAYLANGRVGSANVKTRGLVRGGGRKPWKQKGTGRARFGSTRNPIWRGGGIVFGPTGNENYTHNMHTTAKRQAIRQALTLKEKNVLVIETFERKDGKVAQTTKLLDKIGAKGSVLIVVSQKDDLAERATRNLHNVKAVQANYLNVYDIINADTLVITKKSLDVIHNWLGAAKPAAKKAEA